MSKVDPLATRARSTWSLGLYALVVAGGALLALLVHRLWLLEKSSHFILIVGALLSSGFAALFLRRFDEFLLAVFFFCVPITGLFKTFFLISAGYDDRMTALLLASGVIGVGPLDVVLAALYAIWLFKIFVTRQSPVPTWQWPDAFVALLMLAYVLSSLRAAERQATWFAVFFHVRYVLAYFYLSRNLRWRHLPWILAIFCVVAFLEFALASYQYSTGKLTSLILDRGAGVKMSDQYVVPGIEHRNRATGTCNESHGFGLYMAILAQVFSVGMFHRAFSSRLRFVSAAAFVAVMLSLLCSFSRSAWLAAAVALVLVWSVHLIWGERQVIIPAIMVALLGTALLPWALTIIVERFSSAEGLLSARFEQYPVAWQIWKDHFLLGYGAGNYMWALETYNRPGVLDLPVHNVFLWIGAEMGLLGVVAYFGLAGIVLWRALMAVLKHPQAVSKVGLMVMGCLMASLLDGLTDPLYREPVVYMMFWIMLGVGVALERLGRTAGPQMGSPR